MIMIRNDQNMYWQYESIYQSHSNIFQVHGMMLYATRHFSAAYIACRGTLRLMWSASFSAFFITAVAYSRQKHFAQVAVKSSYESRSLVRSEITQFLPDLRCWVCELSS